MPDCRSCPYAMESWKGKTLRLVQCDLTGAEVPWGPQDGCLPCARTLRSLLRTVHGKVIARTILVRAHQRDRYHLLINMYPDLQLLFRQLLEDESYDVPIRARRYLGERDAAAEVQVALRKGQPGICTRHEQAATP